MKTELVKDKLEGALIDIITKTIDGVDSAVSFLSTEIPEVINQLLMWKFVVHSTHLGVGILILIGLIILNYKQLKSDWLSKEIYNGDADVGRNGSLNPEGVIGVIGLNFLQIPPIILVILFINLKWLQILIAPKLYLIEYAAKLLN